MINWGNSVQNLGGSASVVYKSAIDVGCDTLPHGMCGKESILFFQKLQLQTKTKQYLVATLRLLKKTYIDKNWKQNCNVCKKVL